MEFAGFVVGVIGLAISLGQYMNSRQNTRTLRNWGATMIRQHQTAAETYAQFADRVDKVDREEWRGMHTEIQGILRRSARDSADAALQLDLFIETVAKPGRSRPNATPPAVGRGTPE